MTAYKK